jgi:hypothetical protein
VHSQLFDKHLDGYLDKGRTPTIAALAVIVLDLDVHAILPGYQPEDGHLVYLEQSILGHLDTGARHIDFGTAGVIVHQFA